MEGISDHSLVDCCLKINTCRQRQIFHTYRDYSKFDYNNFLADLFTTDWSLIYSYDNIDDMINFWNSNLITLFDSHAPFRTVRISKSPAPWLTENLKEMIKLRNKAYTKYKKTRSETAWNYYKEIRNTVNMAVKSEKKAYLNFKSKSNPKDFWKALNYLNITCKNNNVEHNFSDPNTFNDFFVNNIPQTESDIQSDLWLEKYSNRQLDDNLLFNFSPVSVEEVEKIVRSIKSNAKGVDGIDLKMLTIIIPHLSDYLTFLINTCLKNNVFPDDWKNSNIIPVPKNNNPIDISQFRPISILPTISKIIEKIVAKQLNEFFTQIIYCQWCSPVFVVIIVLQLHFFM